MKKITPFIAIILTIITGCSHKITATSSVPKEQEITSKINISKGQKYVVENKVTTKGISSMAGQSMETNADVTTVYAIEVKDADGNNYNMTNSISAIKMNMNTMGQNINFDSDKKEDMDGEIGSKFKDFINQPKAVVMDKSGNIIFDPNADTAKANDEGSQTAMILKQMGGDPQEQGYGAKMAFVPISSNAKAGTSWKDSSSAGGVTRQTNYSVKEVKGNIATVSISGTENRDTKMEMQGMEINTKTKGKFTGEETVDITTGVVLQNNVSSDYSGTINVMGQEIPTTATVTSVTTVKPM